MKIKLEIKNRWTGAILFEFEKEGNTIKDTLLQAKEQSADLRGADLRGADLQSADLRGAYLQSEKILCAIVFTGLYDYLVIPYITEKGEKRIKMGCHDRLLEDWESNFWNNNMEFPNNNSVKSNLRVMAFETAKKWLEIIKQTLQ